MKLRLTLVAGACALATAPTVQAAIPAQGEVGTEKLTQKWSGEAAGGPLNLIDEYQRLRCDAPFCDAFTLTVRDTGRLTIAVTATQATGFTEFVLVTPDGRRTYYPGRSGETTNTLEIEDAPVGAYVVESYTNTLAGLSAGSYTGKATLVLPVLE